MYCDLSDIQAIIPPDFLTQALDDDGDGIADAGALVIAGACREVDAILGVRYTVPLDPVPPVATHAAVTLAAEACYLRRGAAGDKNPYHAAAAAVRQQLRDIAAGALPLDPSIGRARPSASIITETSRTAGEQLSL